MEIVKDVAAAIIVRDDRVFAARRGPLGSLAGHWEFPGGKVEPGETVQSCIVRELAEELSIKCSAGAVFARTTYVYDGGAINLIAVDVSMTSNEWHLTVHDDARWIDAGELLSLDWAPADIPIAHKVRDFLLSGDGRKD